MMWFFIYILLAWLGAPWWLWLLSGFCTVLDIALKHREKEDGK